MLVSFEERLCNFGYFIEQLQKERETLLEQVVQTSHKVGELETRLLQLEQPRSDREN